MQNQNNSKTKHRINFEWPIMSMQKCDYYQLSCFSCFFFLGVAYPIVTHWAWAEEGWLASGIDIKHDGEDHNVSYRVRSFVHILGDSSSMLELISRACIYKEYLHSSKKGLITKISGGDDPGLTNHSARGMRQLQQHILPMPELGTSVLLMSLVTSSEICSTFATVSL